MSIFTSKRVITAAALVLLLGPGVAWAGAHFISASDTIDKTTGDLTASFKEAGLGNTPITYDLSANTHYLFQCFTKSGNKPQGTPNAGGPSSENAQTTIQPHNGQITGSLTLDVTFPPTNVACQGGGLKLCLVSATYTDVVLTDTNNNVSVNLNDQSTSAPSGQFIACSEN